MNKYELPIPLPTQGINLTDDSLISDNECAEGTKNISFKDGIPHTRPGSVRVSAHDFADPVHTLLPFQSGGVTTLMVAAGTKLLKQTSQDVFSEVTGSLASDVIDTLLYPCTLMTNFGDKLLVLDGTDYKFYDTVQNGLNAVPAYAPTTEEQAAYGTNVLSTTPDEVNKQKFIICDDNRIWVAGFGKLVRMSHLRMPDYFPSTQVWKLSEDCTGMARYMGEVMLFTENTATLISGSTPDWTLPDKYKYTQLAGGYGCSQHRSIATGDNAIYWANKSGVYRYRNLPTGFSIAECVSEFSTKSGTKSVKKWLKRITDWSKVHAVFFDHEYRLYIGNKQVIVFDTINETWAFYEYDKLHNCALVTDNKLYYATSSLIQADYPYDPDGETYDGLNDDGNAIEFRLKSKFFDFGKAANKKKFKKMMFTLYTELVSYDIDLNINLDNDLLVITDQITNIVARFGDLRFGDHFNTRKTNLNYPVKIRHKGKKYNIQYELVCNQLNMAFTLMSIVLLLKIKELK